MLAESCSIIWYDLENSFEILQTFVVLEITREGSICVLGSCVTNFAKVCSRLPIQAASQVNIFAQGLPSKDFDGTFSCPLIAPAYQTRFSYIDKIGPERDAISNAIAAMDSLQ